MLSADQSTDPVPFRESLWARAHALEREVVPGVASKTSTPAADLEDLWSELLITATRSVGAKGAMDAGAESWSDADLVRWLRRALSNDVIDLYRLGRNKNGESWVVAGSDPLEHLAGSIAPGEQTPEATVVQREGLTRHLQHVHELEGDDAVRLVIADAMGASAADLGMTRRRMRTLRDRLEMASGELRARARAALWFLPDLLMRWFGSGGATPRVGAAAIALTAALAGGAGVATQASHHHGKETAVKRAPANTRSSTTDAAPMATKAAVALPSVQRAAASRRASLASAKRDAARRAAARRAAQRRSAARRAAKRSRDRDQVRVVQRSTSAAAARDEFNFEDQVAAANQAAAAKPSSHASGSASAAAVESEFGP